MIKKRCIDLKGGTNRVDKLKSGPGIPDTGLQSETFSVLFEYYKLIGRQAFD